MLMKQSCSFITRVHVFYFLVLMLIYLFLEEFVGEHCPQCGVAFIFQLRNSCFNDQFLIRVIKSVNLIFL